MLDLAAAQPADFLDIAALDRRAWRRNRSPEFIPDGEHVWRIWAEHALTFCARVDGVLVGAIVAFPCRSGVYCLHKVFVDEAYRSRGVGGALLSRLLEQADALGVSLFLTVDPANEAARRLYRRLGFVEEALVQGYYRPHEDRYVMVRAPRASTT